MRHKLPILAVIPVLLFLVFIPNAYSDFTSNEKYLIQASGYVGGSQNILPSTLLLQITAGGQSGTNMLATLDNGLVTIGDANYLNTGSWTTTILRDGRFLLIQGNAQDQNGNTINLNLFGRIVTTNADGQIFYITGKITGPDTFRVIYSAKVSTVGASATTTTPQTASSTPTTSTQENQTQGNTVNINIVPGASNINNQQFFSPSVVNVPLGTTIIWTNNDSVPHRIMSGIASAVIGNNSAPMFTPDGKIDSGIIAPGKSFQYTITSFDQTTSLSDAAAKYLNLSTTQTYGDISFFDPNYPFMQGVIGPLSVASENIKTAQINILSGASAATSNKYLSPSNVEITPGSTVVWVNNDSVQHRILSGQPVTSTRGSSGPAQNVGKPPQFIPDGRIDSGMIAPGQSYKFTVRGSGAISFYEPADTWLNGIIISTPQIVGPPVEVSILPGSSLSQGAASQSNQQLYNEYYSPSTIQITPGTAIIWKNNDNIPHRVWSGTSTQSNINPFTPDGKIQSDYIPPGSSFEVIVNDTGITRFYDPSYTWMNGIIIALPPTESHTIAAPSHNLGLH